MRVQSRLTPHFLHFVSQYLPDVHLGAAADWPQGPALLVLESFAPLLRRQVLAQAAAHPLVVWVLWQHKNNPGDPSLTILRRTASVCRTAKEEYGAAQEGVLGDSRLGR